MFKRFKKAIENAISALESRSGVEEDVDDILGGMRDELVDAKAQLPKLEEDLEKLRRLHAAEQRKMEECERRARQAKSIDDEETVDVALRFYARHQERAEVYVQKIEGAEAELVVHRSTVQEMTAQLKSAVVNKDALQVQARRAQATLNQRGGERTAADEFDRMVDGIEREDHLGEAMSELDLDLEGPGAGRRRESSLDLDDLADLQLRELKRRMEEESEEG